MHIIVTLALIFVLLCVSSITQAQKVYRCATPEGTVYSQVPCSTDDNKQTVVDVEPDVPSWMRNRASKSAPTDQCKDEYGEWTEAACNPRTAESPTRSITNSDLLPSASGTQRAAPSSANIGPKPMPTLWDGTLTAVKHYMSEHAHDPKSVRWDGCTDARATEMGWITRCDYRARNGFGALVKQRTLFIIRDHEVISAQAVN